MTMIDHTVIARRRDHLAEQHHALAASGEDVTDRFDRVRLDNSDHADTAIEGAQQLQFVDAALLRQPLENWQHWQPGKVDADSEMPRQDARDIVRQTAPGDVSQRFDGAGLADGAQAGSNIEPGRQQQRAGSA